MKDERYFDGTCMMCYKTPIPVRHIGLYIMGSEGFFCCHSCEMEVVKFIREEGRKAIRKKLEEVKCLKKSLSTSKPRELTQNDMG